jgi:hypothetical protein
MIRLAFWRRNPLDIKGGCAVLGAEVGRHVLLPDLDDRDGIRFRSRVLRRHITSESNWRGERVANEKAKDGGQLGPVCCVCCGN